jgi:hypothetical protein
VTKEEVASKLKHFVRGIRHDRIAKWTTMELREESKRE